MGLRSALVLAVVVAVLPGCSMGSAIPDPRTSASATVGPPAAPSRPTTKLAIAKDTCWTGELLGSDPQLALKLANLFGITYFEAAYAIKDRPAFLTKQSCAKAHAIEVYQVVPVSAVTPQVTEYGTLLRTGGLDFSQLSASVALACTDRALQAAARLSSVPGASLQPALPDGFRTGWAPPTLEQWNRGQRVFACTLVQDRPNPLRYRALRTRSFPTSLRTCIASGARIYVDCARKHDRERIAVLDVGGAVAAGVFPGRSAVRKTADGRSYLDVDAAFYRPLDRACTAYLRAVSTDRRLSGVAEIDVDSWPGADGVYPVSCEADAPATEPSKVTTGSVYDR